MTVYNVIVTEDAQHDLKKLLHNEQAAYKKAQENPSNSLVTVPDNGAAASTKSTVLSMKSVTWKS